MLHLNFQIYIKQRGLGSSNTKIHLWFLPPPFSQSLHSLRQTPTPQHRCLQLSAASFPPHLSNTPILLYLITDSPYPSLFFVSRYKFFSNHVKFLQVLILLLLNLSCSNQQLFGTKFIYLFITFHCDECKNMRLLLEVYQFCLWKFGFFIYLFLGILGLILIN